MHAALLATTRTNICSGSRHPPIFILQPAMTDHNPIALHVSESILNYCSMITDSIEIGNLVGVKNSTFKFD